MRECNIYKAIERISVRTGMYLQEVNLAGVSDFLVGYGAAMADAGIEDLTSPNFSYFLDWLTIRYKFRSNRYGWVKMILALALGCDPGKKLPLKKLKKATKEDHQKSVELYFDLVEQYRNDKEFPEEMRKILQERAKLSKIIYSESAPM